MRTEAPKLGAKKPQSSLEVEGELAEDGLAAFRDDGDVLMLALARQTISGEEETEADESVEDVIAQARDSEAASEEFLVDDKWKLVETEPKAVEVNGNHDEDTEPQQSLFSWAEFMADEPVKPRGRSRKPQPATISMFQRALTLEQEWEAELVGAGR